jgi:class 3 adenylate cyclase
MLLRLRHVVPWILPFLLTLSLWGAIRAWETWRHGFQAERSFSRWQEECVLRWEEFKAGYSYETQIDHLLQLVHQDLLSSTPAKRHRPVTATGFSRALRRRVPGSFLPTGTRQFGFLVDQKDRCEVFSGRDFTQAKGRIVGRFFGELLSLSRQATTRVSAMDKRARQLFGPLLSGESLMAADGHQVIQVVFEGRPLNLLWKSFPLSTEEIAILVWLFPQSPNRTGYLDRALRTLVWKNDPGFIPVLLPQEIRRAGSSPTGSQRTGTKLPTIIPDPLEANPVLGEALRTLIGLPARDDLIKIGTRSTTPSGIRVFREPVGFDLPYELWIFGPSPEQSLPVSRSLLIVLLLFWSAVFSRVFLFGAPIARPLRWWFAFYLFLISGIPVLMVYLMGASLIDLEEAGTIDQTISARKKHFEALDLMGTTHLHTFGDRCGKLLEKPEFRDFLNSGPLTATHPIVLEVFSGFADRKMPLEALMVYRIGKGLTILGPDGNTPNLEDAFTGFYQPMILGTYKLFDPYSFSEVLNQLPPLQLNVFNVYFVMAGKGLFGQLAYLRQEAELFQTGDTQVFQYFDILTDHGKIHTGVVFRAPALTAFLGYLRPQARNGRQASSNLGLGWKEPDGKRFFEPLGPLSPGDHKILRRLIAGVLKTGISRTRALPGHRVGIAVAGRRMKNHVLAELVDVNPLLDLSRRKKRILGLISVAMLGCVMLMGFGLGIWFFQPLQNMEIAIRRILNRDLEVRLAMDRDDELGDVSQSIDSMTQGLKERYELGCFVSGALESSVQENSHLDSTPRVKTGAVLASDIRSFTTMSEEHPVTQIVQMLNIHLDIMSREIQKNGGTIEEFIGDAVIAVFLDDRPEECMARAVAAARGMMQAHAAISAQREREGVFPYRMGVGISFGDLMIGTFGSGNRRKFAVLGDPRVRAEEMEAASKDGRHTLIVLDPKAALYAGDVRLAPLSEGTQEVVSLSGTSV